MKSPSDAFSKTPAQMLTMAGITEEDFAILAVWGQQQVYPVLSSLIPRFRQFNQQLASQSGLVLASDRWEALEKHERNWLESFFGGGYGPAFWEQQEQVGQVHAKLEIPEEQLSASFHWLRMELTSIGRQGCRPALWALLDACQLAIIHAYQHALLEKELKRVRGLLHHYELSEFFAETAHLARDMACCADGVGLIERHGTDQLHYRFFDGLPDAFRDVAVSPFPESEGVTGQAMRTRQPLYVPDYPHSPFRMPDFVAAGLRGSLVIPLLGPEGFQGALALSWFASPPPVRISEDHWEYLRLLADMLGMALHRQAVDQRLAQLATHDMLTGLPNRRVADERIQISMSRADRQQQLFALLFLDLDGFKRINDQFGHGTGDRTLREVAKSLQQEIRPSDTVIRYAGDEFLLLLEGLSHEQEAREIAERVRKTIQRIIWEGERELPLSASIGISIYPMDRADSETMIHYADQAMYQAKSQGGNQWSYHDPNLDKKERAALTLSQELLRAWERREFRLYWQPIVQLSDQRIIGAEALLRWQHPSLGVLVPGTFLSALEDSPLMNELGHWVLAQGIAQAAQWQADGYPLLVHLNVASRQLRDPTFVGRLSKELAHFPALPPESLSLEIVERVIIDDIPDLSRIIQEARQLGLHFSLDDFGIGSSPIQLLVDLDCDALKIDISLVRGCVHDQKRQKIIEVLVQMSEVLQMTLVAEGIEDEETAQLLQVLGVEKAQGYFFAKPLPLSDFEALLAAELPFPRPS